MKRNIFATMFVVLLATVSWAQDNAAFAEHAQNVIDKFANAPTLRHATVGVMVCDIDSGKLIASHNPDLSVITASSMKTVTSSAALLLLGSQYRFKTPVFLVGEIDGETLHGDLVVVGCGDPTLGSKHFPENPNIVEEIVQGLKSRGIRKINGKIILDQSLISYPDYPVEWEVEDLAWGYGAGVNAVNFSDNRLHLRFTSKDGEISNVSIAPSVPGLEVINKLSRGNADNVNVLLESGHPSLILYGKASNSENYDLTLANPIPGAMLADSIAHALRNADINLRNHDNAVKAEFEGARTLLVEHESPSLPIIIKSLLDRSDNMFTEALLLAIAGSQGREVSTANGVEVVRELWRNVGLDVDPLFQSDGSGLARTNKASVTFFAQMLSYMSRQRFNGMALCDLMPHAGTRIGTPMANSKLRDNIALKSGSMQNVQTFVGYYPADSPRYAWAILVNNFRGTRASLKDNMGQLLINLFGDK